MEFGGFQKITLIDYPNKIACTLFTLGCNFSCFYCQNPELVLKDLIRKQPKIKEEEVLDFLKERQGLIEGVCITGGEPLIHFDALKKFLKKVKNLGYAIKLDHNGSCPKELEELIKKGYLDYVALDVKAPKEKYNLLTGVKDITKKVDQSIKVLKNGKIDYEFRTTLAPFLNKEDIFKIVDWIKPARAYFLQKFQSQKILNPNFYQQIGFKEIITDQELKEIQEKIKDNFLIFKIR